MSAHWYWDWDWGRSGPGTQPATIKQPAAAANTTPHQPNQPAPFPYPTNKPCQKLQIYAGTADPGTALPPSPPWPNLQWEKLEQREVDADDNTLPTSAPVAWYWIACQAVGDCCQGAGGCKLYRTWVLIRKKDPSKPGDKDVYIRDFKCKCHNK